MYRLIFIMSLLVGYACNAQADDWSTEDKWLFGIFISASAIDASQTLEGLDERFPNGQPKYREANPLYGDNPSDKRIIYTKLVGVGIVWALAELYPKSRNNILWGVDAITLGIVAHNYSIGVNMGF
jgi:hypothetical protein